MQALRKLLNKPKLEDGSLLSLFYYCDIAVNHQMQELNTLMRVTPDNLDRRSVLIRQLKEAQHNLMNVIMSIADQVIPEQRAPRDFRAKYPDDVLLDQISGPIWFGAECIAAGSHIANHEVESAELRPYATHLSKVITKVREALRLQSCVNRDQYPQKMKDTLVMFDEMWADFEFRYVSLMCSVKTESQYYHQQDVVVLFCESTLRAIKKKYLTYEMIEMMDPSAMFAIPRLAILCGLVVYPDGPLNPSRPSKDMPQCFRAYKQLLTRIRLLLKHLTQEQLDTLEQALCSAEGLGTLERNKQKAAKKKTVKPAVVVVQPDSEQTTSAAAAAEATVSVATPPRRPLSAVVQQSRPAGAEANSTLPPSPSRRHSYNLDSRDTAANTVFEPLPVSNTPGTASSMELGHSSEAAGMSEPFPDLGRNQPVENNLPSSSSTHLFLPPSVDPAPSSSTSSTSLTPPASDAAPGTAKDAKPTGKRPRGKGPAGFPSIEDLMHRLFLGISGVADQLQTNHAKDLRVILKNVFYVCQSETESEDEDEDEEGEEEVSLYPRESSQTKYSGGSVNDLEPCTTEPQSPLITASQRLNFPTESLSIEHSPTWIPDSDSPICSLCTEKFSWKKRRHHCRSCGNVVCSKCSPNSLPLLHFGIRKHVRVCTNCYISQLGEISRTVKGITGQPLQVQ